MSPLCWLRHHKLIKLSLVQILEDVRAVGQSQNLCMANGWSPARTQATTHTITMVLLTAMQTLTSLRQYQSSPSSRQTYSLAISSRESSSLCRYTLLSSSKLDFISNTNVTGASQGQEPKVLDMASVAAGSVNRSRQLPSWIASEPPWAQRCRG